MKATEIVFIWEDRRDPTVRFEYKTDSEHYTVGDISLPTLKCRIERNHLAGAFYNFLLGFCHP